MLGEYQNKKKQGDAGMGVAICWFSLRGWTVAIPLTDSQPYDLVVEAPGGEGLKKVQVKTTTMLNKYGRYEVSLRTCGGNRSGYGNSKNFDPSEVDLVFVITQVGDQYLIPSVECGGSTLLTLGEKYLKFRCSGEDGTGSRPE